LQGKYIDRDISEKLVNFLNHFPCVALLGPRQSGKSTLAKKVLENWESPVLLDLERPSDLQKLNEPELFFRSHENHLVCLDEIQRKPEIFRILRSVIDSRDRNSQFLILGSASRNLIRQSSESLAGRIVYLELTPFLTSEAAREDTWDDEVIRRIWFRGGFPRSYLAESDEISQVWRNNFIRTFLERDIPQLGFRIPADSLFRLWQMCAHSHGQLLNQTVLGQSLGLSHVTIRSYLEILAQTYTLRLLRPFQKNIKKRLVKTPKLYLRDSGLLHALLNIPSFTDLMGHPVYGASWESMAMENIIAWHEGCEFYFYRTSAGAELDLLLVKGNRKIGFEFKASMAPTLQRGFWNSLEDLQPEMTYIIAPVKESYPVKERVLTTNLKEYFNRHRMAVLK
jgi:predicted AAA+ superfamily ATPase